VKGQTLLVAGSFANILYIIENSLFGMAAVKTKLIVLSCFMSA